MRLTAFLMALMEAGSEDESELSVKRSGVRTKSLAQAPCFHDIHIAFDTGESHERPCQE